MKGWTQHEARPAQIVEADQFNDQHREFRGQMTGLDRAQYPADCLTEAMIVDGARHRVWTFVPWDTGTAWTAGEQDVVMSTNADAHPEQFRGATYQLYSSGWLTAFETQLTPFQGGSLLTEWFGNTALQTYFTWTNNARQDSTPKGRQADRYVGLRILYNNVVVVERLGPAKPIDCFRIVGESQMPNGDVTVTFQFKLEGAGPDDPIKDTAGKHLLQGHLWGNRVVCVGRWR
jgi:hypothetical protein